MKASRKFLMIFGIAAASVLLVGTVRSWATGVVTFGGQVGSGGTSFILDPVTYDLGTGEVTGTVRFTDTTGVSSILGSPTPAFFVMRRDATGIISNATVTCTPSIEGGTTIKWEFSYTVPSGYTFFGVGVTGSYVNSSSVTWSFDSTIGGHADTDDID